MFDFQSTLDAVGKGPYYPEYWEVCLGEIPRSPIVMAPQVVDAIPVMREARFDNPAPETMRQEEFEWLNKLRLLNLALIRSKFPEALVELGKQADFQLRSDFQTHIDNANAERGRVQQKLVELIQRELGDNPELTGAAEKLVRRFQKRIEPAKLDRALEMQIEGAVKPLLDDAEILRAVHRIYVATRSIAALKQLTLVHRQIEVSLPEAADLLLKTLVAQSGRAVRKFSGESYWRVQSILFHEALR